jgi:hypothetical protein
MRELLGEGHGVTLVALNVDPNEDEAAVRAHVESNDLSGTFAVPPQSMLDALVGQFGAEFLTPPAVPVVLLDAEQTEARLLDRGVKSREELLEELP